MIVIHTTVFIYIKLINRGHTERWLSFMIHCCVLHREVVEFYFMIHHTAVL